MSTTQLPDDSSNHNSNNHNHTVGAVPFTVFAPWPELSEAALYGLAGDILRALTPETEADPAAILIQFLVAFGSVVGRGPCYRFAAECHHTNEFAMVVGPTAQGRKGMSKNLALRLFWITDLEFNQKCIQTGLSTAEGLILAVADASWEEQPIRKSGEGVIGYQLVRTNPGVSDKRLLVVESEASVLLRRMTQDANTISDVLKDAWDGANLQTMTKKQPLRATAPHISWIAHTTPTDLRQLMSQNSLFNGFANRILWCCSRRSKSLAQGGNLSDKTMFEFQSRVAEAFSFARSIREVTRNGDACELWEREYEALSSQAGDRFGAATARAVAHVTRLSCIYALLDHSGVIRKEHLEAALAAWRYCEDSARYLFASPTASPAASLAAFPSATDRVAVQIFKALQSAPGHSMSRTEISGIFSGNRCAHEIDTALTGLQEQGRVFRIRQPPPHRNGRPSEIWTLSDPR